MKVSTTLSLFCFVILVFILPSSCLGAHLKKAAKLSTTQANFLYSGSSYYIYNPYWSKWLCESNATNAWLEGFATNYGNNCKWTYYYNSTSGDEYLYLESRYLNQRAWISVENTDTVKLVTKISGDKLRILKKPAGLSYDKCIYGNDNKRYVRLYRLGSRYLVNRQTWCGPYETFRFYSTN